jgi:hypothetical protein
MKITDDDERFDRLITALTKISHGTDQPHGFEALVMALTGDSISGRQSLARAVVDGHDGVAAAILEHARATHRVAAALERRNELGR